MKKDNIEPIKPFKLWCIQNFPFIADDFDQMTYYELLCKIVEYLNKTIDSQNKVIDNMNYVLNYFNNLDVQDEINNKLDKMVEDGTLEEILAEYLRLACVFGFNNVSQMLNYGFQNGDLAITKGYYQANDGGGAKYSIREKTPSDVEDGGSIHFLSNNLVAELLVKNNTVNVKQFGAKGDGLTDDTLKIQNAIDYLNNGKQLYFPSGTYIVSKNTNLIYENNQQPCLLIHNKSNLTLYGDKAKLKVNAHAQGILEIVTSNHIYIDGIEFEGYGQFPTIQSDGRGEKGYYSEDVPFGRYKNNSYNTVGKTNITGTFGNGYICNIGIGILMYNVVSDIYIKNCKVSGFNYSGISVGDYYLEGYIENIYIEKNEIFNCYDDGINLINCKNVNVYKNNIHNIGHPDATITMTNTNPGYGITSRDLGTSSNTASNIVNITDNYITNCVRKGIDVHNGFNFIIKGNSVRDCWFNGIAFLCPSQRGIIAENIVINCGYKDSGIGIEGTPDEKQDIFANVVNNVVHRCGGYDNKTAQIKATYVEKANISNNQITGLNTDASSTSIFYCNQANCIDFKNNFILVTYPLFYGIDVENTCNDINVENNTISANKYNTSYIRHAGNSGNLINNSVKFTGDVAQVGNNYGIVFSGTSKGFVGGNKFVDSDNNDLVIRYSNHNGKQIPYINYSQNINTINLIKNNDVLSYNLQ